MFGSSNKASQSERSEERTEVSSKIRLYLFRYVMDKQSEDYLLIGFANNKQNPYREKSSCQLL